MDEQGIQIRAKQSCCMVIMQAASLVSLSSAAGIQRKAGLYVHNTQTESKAICSYSKPALQNTSSEQPANVVGLAEGTTENVKVKPPWHRLLTDGHASLCRMYRDCLCPCGASRWTNGREVPRLLFQRCEFDSSLTAIVTWWHGHGLAQIQEAGCTNGSHFLLGKKWSSPNGMIDLQLSDQREAFWIIDSLQMNDTIRKVSILREDRKLPTIR
jgi:hypothetical protein